MSKESLKQLIDAEINTNGEKEITGQKLNSVLNTIVDDTVNVSDLGVSVAALVDGKVLNSNIDFGSVSDGDVKPVNGGEVYGQIGTNIASLVGGKVPDEQINIGSVSEGSSGLVRGKDVYDAINPLIYEYTHSGNKEIHITDINYDTNTFTSIGHGLVNSTGYSNTIGLVLTRNNVIDFTKLPINSGIIYVINVTENTFQLSLEINGTPEVLINRGTVDYNSFHFELRGNVSYTFNNTNLDKYCKIEIDFIALGSSNSSYFNLMSNGYDITESGDSSYSTRSARLNDINNSLLGKYIIECFLENNHTILKYQVKSIRNLNEKIKVVNSIRNVLSLETTDLNNIIIRGIPLANGAKIRLYGK